MFSYKKLWHSMLETPATNVLIVSRFGWQMCPILSQWVIPDTLVCGDTNQGGRTRKGDGLWLKAWYWEQRSPCPDSDGKDTNPCFPITQKHNLWSSEPPYTRPVRTVVWEVHR